MASPQSDKPGRRSLRALARIAARASGPGRTKRIQGFVDAVLRGDTIVGWARDTRDPSRRLEIQLLNHEEIVGFAIADLPRKDLLAADMGDGRYGFRLRLSPLMLDGTSRNLRVCAITERGKVMLERGSVTIAANAPPEPALESKPDTHALVGAMERLNGRALHGWAFNPNQPDVPALVDVYEDERYLGSVMADRSRPRLYEKGFPSGARGFVFELPVTDQVLSGRLRARVAGTMYELARARDFGDRGPARDTGDDAAAPVERSARAAPIVSPSPAPTPAQQPPRPARAGVAPLAVAGGPGAIGLWPVGKPDPGGHAIEDWAAQHHADLRVVASADRPVPARLAGDATWIHGARRVEQVARDTGFVLFARADARLDPHVAGTLAALPGFPDVIILDEGRTEMTGDAARLETFLAPVSPGMFAVRSDLLAGYPGDLERDLADGLLSPLRLWLAGRTDLRWTRVAAPVDAPRAVEESGGHRARAWRTVLPDERWRVTDGLIVPTEAPRRLSIGLWAGWDEPDLPTLRALIAATDVPLDILVPTNGDAARGGRRCAAAEAAVAALGNAAARARIVDCADGPEATCAALLAAADGDCVLLSDAAALPDAATLRRMAAWSLHPRVGMTGVASHAGQPGGVAITGEAGLAPVGADGGGTAADAMSFGLMMIATRCLGAVGGPALDRYGLSYAPVEFGLRLARYGFQTMLVPGEVAGPVPAPLPIGPLPWHIVARLRADLLIGG